MFDPLCILSLSIAPFAESRSWSSRQSRGCWREARWPCWRRPWCWRRAATCLGSHPATGKKINKCLSVSIFKYFGPNLAHIEVDEFLLLFLLEGVEQRLPLYVGCGVSKPAKKDNCSLAETDVKFAVIFLTYFHGFDCRSYLSTKLEGTSDFNK